MMQRHLICAAGRHSKEDSTMRDFMIGLAFVAMLVAPAILATIQKARSRDVDD